MGRLADSSAHWAEVIALNWLVWDLTGSALAIGVANMYRYMPVFFLSLVGGVAADRFDKRKLLLATQSWSLSIYAVLGILILGGWVQMWHIYLAASLVGVGKSIEQPVRASLIAQVIEQRHLLNAISLNSIAINATRMIVPVLIGLLIGIAGAGPAFIAAASFYVLVLWTTLMLRPPAPQAIGSGKSGAGELVEGFKHVLHNRQTLPLILMALGPLVFASGYTTMLPVFSTEVLNMGSLGFGALQSMIAIGALVGGLTLAFRGDIRHKGKLMITAGVVYGILVIMLGGLQWLVLAFLIVMLTGASQVVFRASNNSTLLQLTPTQFQGRVISLNYLVIGLRPLSSLLAGAVIDARDISAGLAVLGAITVIIVAGIALAAPGIRRL